MFYCNADGSRRRNPGCGTESESEEDDPYNQCYLCHHSVPEPEWKSGEHRTLCAAKNAGQLQGFKTIDVKCSQCREPLRLWPKMGGPFSCSTGYRCGHPRDRIINTGINRFNCFQCDIDFCLPCVEEKMA
eukprot:TRINITY_DN12626_c0_g1_i1.p1 TRINITY_DN12626_c0_g1~~TRINITY_DN12626_c0_g1_i1.p1  ORF type:complete len:130 (+),score=21.57 TRINITY_DN12626_c0_g1_i1:237-626(+)